MAEEAATKPRLGRGLAALIGDVEDDVHEQVTIRANTVSIRENLRVYLQLLKMNVSISFHWYVMNTKKCR